MSTTPEIDVGGLNIKEWSLLILVGGLVFTFIIVGIAFAMAIMNPESDIGSCHGPLKEGLQDLIIQKLHSYLVQNLGRINLEVLDLPIQIE